MPYSRQSIFHASGRLGELKINNVKFPCLSASRPGTRRAPPARDEPPWKNASAPFEGDALTILSKRISDFTSRSAERLHLRLSLTKPGKSQSSFFFDTPPLFFLQPDRWAASFSFFFATPSRCPCQSAWRSLVFHQWEKEQARTAKMNDINGQPILPGTSDWDKWALLH